RRTPWRPSWRSASPVICSGTHYPCDVVISIVVPIHNETETLAELHRRLTTVLAELAPYEVVLVDDGSTDDSWERMLAVAAGVRLLSRRALAALSRMPERARFLRGMTSWVGFRQVGVQYERDARYAGETKYPARRMIRFALDAITSFSTTPIQVVTSLGFV